MTATCTKHVNQKIIWSSNFGLIEESVRWSCILLAVAFIRSYLVKILKALVYSKVENTACLVAWFTFEPVFVFRFHNVKMEINNPTFFKQIKLSN